MVELYNLLSSLDLPVAYHHFKTPPKLPYIVYLFSYASNFAADNRVYEKLDNYQVELYDTKKNLAAEKLIENLFYENSIYYSKSETFIDSEGLYQVLYEIKF